MLFKRRAECMCSWERSLLQAAVDAFGRTCQVGVVRTAELSRLSAFRMRMYLKQGEAGVQAK